MKTRAYLGISFIILEILSVLVYIAIMMMKDIPLNTLAAIVLSIIFIGVNFLSIVLIITGFENKDDKEKQNKSNRNNINDY